MLLFFFQGEFENQLKNCDAIIVMYSLTDRVSFHVAREILDDLASLQNIICPVLLLANKMDLCHHRKVRIISARATKSARATSSVSASKSARAAITTIVTETTREIMSARATADSDLQIDLNSFSGKRE